MSRLFGTDGVRGRANDELTAELALRLAAATAEVLHTPGSDSDRPVAVVGRDPRASSEFLEAAVCAGLAAHGVDAIRLGVVPTPTVAFLTADYDATFGVMISASHNPMPDNGIKIFGPGGHKLDDEVENRIEAAMTTVETVPRPTGADIGRLREAPDSAQRYLDHLAEQVDIDLSGLTVVVDCANGAASQLGPQAYRAAGATVIPIFADPDGLNINDACGSTHMEKLTAAVLEHGADLGLAHDGDADRCLAVDADGNLVDGDMIMAVLATAMAEKGNLADGVLVATVMSNLGLHLAMEKAGIELRTTAVGDRYVLEELRRGGYALGGEQSGHIVVPAAGTTGDGILTGLLLMEQLASTRQSLACLASIMTVLPQELINVRVADKHAVAQAETVRDAVTAAEAELAGQGRVLLRPSGTEQLVRVMVEAPTADAAHGIAARIADVVAGAGA
ncbi:MAG TPA: phosphoglucosamine mutase [Gordonia sp. (in: high G+C Gram-positive bacteria)]|uniref:phosphoglucosamine mutase n=1 Tax=unclassified Gordonia (in: high G+C Gram-positive bacteria) TaxID=2657482 RepID=UPI000FBAAEAB|nr:MULTISPECIES: phosphoglucosamine mutase [unclassified Gordonia (in: high G+C Gram-positive bacteria)]RUP37788.1 MAG: phosphoglucosamine mutase [Gordonia sp. (in: high G+C Gram-positive bacteria)]HNP55356.1 phosphoglucosamine mutase [Gordonia sp. (in: high G+C Gram-positive bacteria)]HRC50072.1 phosphoglucosamine mutase [Gordonia sp. (in: high G+C Gram-positive bacteria)]